MLSQAAIAAYRRDGFIVLPDILTPEEVEALRRLTDEFVHNARNVAANDEVYDLEESHSSTDPRVRRIKAPHLHDPEYARTARHPKIVEVLQDLWGTVRFDADNRIVTRRRRTKRAGPSRTRLQGGGGFHVEVHQFGPDGRPRMQRAWWQCRSSEYRVRGPLSQSPVRRRYPCRRRAQPR